MSRVQTYENFADTPCPWVADDLFWQQNDTEVREVMDLVAQDFPHVADIVDFDPNILPDSEQRAALWKLLMGRQHGLQEQSDGKVVISPEHEVAYRGSFDRLRYGDYSLMAATVLDHTVAYEHVGLIGGSPIENVHHLEAVTQNPVHGENVSNIVALTGQRLRGIWNLPGEHSVSDLFEAVGVATGTDMDELSVRSPWIRAELRRQGTDWEAPFATEHEIFRLVGEASMVKLIDWRNYIDTVQTIDPHGPNADMRYSDGDKVVIVPPRQQGLVTYELIDGRKLHIVNGAATPRAQGMPRATSTSIAEEALSYLIIPEGVNIAAVAQAPHLRASMDTAIAYLNTLGPEYVRRFDVAAASWEPTITHITAMLGEIMATMKADYRLRAVLLGDDPNAPDLLAI